MKKSSALILTIAAFAACGSPTAPTFVCPPGWTCTPAAPAPSPAPPAPACAPPAFTGQVVKIEPESLAALDAAAQAAITARPDLFYPDGGIVGWPSAWDDQKKVAGMVYDELIRRLLPRCAYVQGDDLIVQRSDKDYDAYHVLNYTGALAKSLDRGYKGTQITVK